MSLKMTRKWPKNGYREQPYSESLHVNGLEDEVFGKWIVIFQNETTNYIQDREEDVASIYSGAEQPGTGSSDSWHWQ